jgi:hypothetical protein
MFGFGKGKKKKKELSEKEILAATILEGIQQAKLEMTGVRKVESQVLAELALLQSMEGSKVEFTHQKSELTDFEISTNIKGAEKIGADCIMIGVRGDNPWLSITMNGKRSTLEGGIKKIAREAVKQGLIPVSLKP